MNFWNDRYSQAGYAYGTEPSDFLVEHATLIPPGRVLCIAEGEGRNAVYLAQQGYQVHAIDLSDVGLRKAEALAATRGVTITTQTADLADTPLPPGPWQGIVSLWAHMPSAVRARLHAQIADALVPGGLFLLEAYTLRQLELGGKGGPGPHQKDFYMSADALRDELHGLDFLRLAELDRLVNEGQFHGGLSGVVQAIARKAK